LKKKSAKRRDFHFDFYHLTHSSKFKANFLSQGPEEFPRSGEDDEEQGQRSVRDNETEDRHRGSTLQRLTPQPTG
jgi:hypothetical protein